MKLIVCGSSNSGMPSFPQWDRTVLEYTYDQVDYLSLHSYYFNHGSDADFLASFMDMDQFIDTVIATADYVKSKKRGKKDIMLSFDEWNIWYPNDSGDHPWQQAPALLENQYSLLDALVLGGLACSLINHASRVKIACLAQLVNVIAPIFTQKGGAAIRQTIFYPFMQVSRYGRGTALRAQVEAPEVATDKYGAVKGIYTSAVHDEENGELAVFALNLGKEDLSTAFDLRSFGKASVIEHTVLRGDKLDAVNTFDHPDAVVPVQAPVNAGESGSFELTLPALSWNLVRFKIK